MSGSDRASAGQVFRGYAFIVGAMKCGTSTLHHLLGLHPQVATGKRKELNYFTRWVAPHVSVYEERAFPELDKSKHIYTLDSSPNYTKTAVFPVAPQRLAAMPGKKRLVYLMRNPVDRIESHLTHNATRDRTIDDRAIEIAVHTSRYALHLDIYEALGLRPDMLLLDFDDLVADPLGVTRRVFEFLDIEPVPIEFDRVHNKRKTKARYTTRKEEARYAELVRDDVRQLIDRYHFEPAKKWGIA